MKRKWKIFLSVLSGVVLFIVLLVAFRYPILEWLLSKQMSKQNIPGVTITLINDNAIKWSRSYGVIKNGSGVPVSTETLFQAASVTKTLVAALALNFVEKGMIGLDEDINDYLRSWQLPGNEFTDKKKVTLRLLLTHRSGLPETNLSYENGPPPSLVQVLKGEAPALNKPAIVEYIPGSRWQYSNIAYAVIQLLIEDVGGQSIEKIMQAVIFKPLHMKNSTFVYPLAGEFSNQKEAMPHDDYGKAYPAALHPTAVAQGGLLSTSADIAKFLIALMRSYQGESGLIISRDMVRQMFMKEIDLDPKILGGIPAAQGLGVFIAKGDKFYIFSVGDNAPGSTCWAVGIPEIGKGTVVMTNGHRGFDLSIKIIGALLITNLWPMPDM
ncbi:MAG: beta-lactamase family protein [Candidatus Aminicenantes bacterium]|nr:beta-lactamase family protein [Candidatus Aminicenantes bacterium]